MRRVQAISILRRIFSPSFGSAIVFLAALWGIGREVWVARVLENMPQSGDILAVLQFFSAAFGNTEGIVQVFTVLTLFSAAYLARETGRFVSLSLAPLQTR